MFQPLSAYTVAPQMQQQQNLADALRGGGAAPVEQAPVAQGGAPSWMRSAMQGTAPGAANMLSPVPSQMVGLLNQVRANPSQFQNQQLADYGNKLLGGQNPEPFMSSGGATFAQGGG